MTFRLATVLCVLLAASVVHAGEVVTNAAEKLTI